MGAPAAAATSPPHESRPWPCCLLTDGAMSPRWAKTMRRRSEAGTCFVLVRSTACTSDKEGRGPHATSARSSPARDPARERADAGPGGQHRHTRSRVQVLQAEHGPAPDPVRVRLHRAVGLEQLVGFRVVGAAAGEERQLDQLVVAGAPVDDRAPRSWTVSMPRWTSTPRPPSATTTKAWGWSLASSPLTGASASSGAGIGSMAVPGPTSPRANTSSGTSASRTARPATGAWTWRVMPSGPRCRLRGCRLPGPPPPGPRGRCA